MTENPLFSNFDYKNPDYTPIFQQRMKMLAKLRLDPSLVTAAKTHYKDNAVDFINDWGMTFDPRALSDGRLANMPFILWPQQKEFLVWLEKHWRENKRGVVEKSRDCGVTWLCVGWAVCKWAFYDNFVIGFGSRKADMVDTLGNPDSIFEKIRHFIAHVPSILLPPDFDFVLHAREAKIISPHTGSTLAGESGDQIGRGGRKSVHFNDEAAFIERQSVVDRALSMCTNCQIDLSTPNGNGNEFYRKVHRYKPDDVFRFSWRMDPRKSQEWYQEKCEQMDEQTIAQELNCDYNASASDAFIPAKWVAAAIDAHITLKLDSSGARITAFDPADVGDGKGLICLQGSIVVYASTIREGDITDAVPYAYDIADKHRADIFIYDADGLGGPAMKFALARANSGRMQIQTYYGSSSVIEPRSYYEERSISADDFADAGRKTNEDKFANFRAQTWTWLRDSFQLTYVAVERAKKGQVVNVDPSRLISISTKCEEWQVLQAELSRPKRQWTENGKIKVESKRDMKLRGVDSPNLADALVQARSARRKMQAKRAEFNYVPHVILDRSVGY